MYKILIITALLFLIHTGYAQISVQPAVKQIVLEQDNVQGFFNVKNLSQQNITVKIKAEDWPNKPDNTVYSWEKWLKLSDKIIDLKAGESRKVNYSVHLPKSMNQEAVAMVYFTPEQQAGINIQSRYGCTLYIQKKGTEKYLAEIERITVQISPQGNYYTDIIIHNKGNIHLLPKAYLIINKEKQRIAYVPLYITKPLYANEKKIFTIEWPDKKMPGTYYGKLILCFGPDQTIEKDFVFAVDINNTVQNFEADVLKHKEKH